ncbi:uncharacterized protein NPIL_211621 [Nephila pilipes]|uniref:Retrotransposon gag domain-containing protein n=1 Tax=Nephila pilipes TaxID=299642 RepID=A0A8X6ISS6_NEPPI|nr:uncharacterized protein NPIL_211621 [Nephila pilipes]
MFHEIPANLACAYLKGHLIGKARDWFEVISSSYVTGTATDFAQLKQALTNSFPVVRDRLELEAGFYSSHQVRSQAPSDFVYKLLKIQKILNFEITEENLVNRIIMRLSRQVMDYVEVRNTTTKIRYRFITQDEGVVETDGLNGEGSKAEQVRTEGSKGLASEESSKEEQWRGRRVRSEGSIEFSSNYEGEYQSKRMPHVRLIWRKRSAPSSLVENSEVKRLPQGSYKTNLSCLTVDGRKNISGIKKCLIGLVKQMCNEKNIPQLMFLDCIIHQQALCAKYVDISSVLNPVVNLIRPHGLKHRQFRDMLKGAVTESHDLQYYTAVRWLSCCEKVMSRVFESRKEIDDFLESKGKPLLSDEMEIGLCYRHN